MFKSIRLKNWRQFDNVDISFHKRLTIITGVNASGKTTILKMLEDPNNFHFNDVCILKQKTNFYYICNKDVLNKISNQSVICNNSEIYGKIETFIDNFSVLPFEAKDYVRENNIVHEYREHEFNRDYQRKLQDFHSFAFHRGKHSIVESHCIKHLFVSPAFDDHKVKIDNLLRKFLPSYLEFYSSKIEIQMRTFGSEHTEKIFDVILETKTGSFLLENASGGLSKAINIILYIYIYLNILNHKSLTVIIDEPENHLHPSMQREFLPTLLELFPSLQFIVATHSPLIVSSCKDSNVYLLGYNENNRVESRSLDMLNKAGSAVEILQDALGVPFTMPVWVEEKYNKILKKYKNCELSDKILDNLREELEEINLGKIVPTTIVKLLDDKDEEYK